MTPSIGMLAMRMRTSGNCGATATTKIFGTRSRITCAMSCIVPVWKSISQGVGMFVVRM